MRIFRVPSDSYHPSDDRKSCDSPALKQEISSYTLPEPRTQQLYRLLDRQNELARLMASKLPIVTATVNLFKDEVCHLDISAQALVGSAEDNPLLTGRFIVTSERLMMLSPQGSVAIQWSQCRALESLDRSLVVVNSVQNLMILCDDPNRLRP